MDEDEFKLLDEDDFYAPPNTEEAKFIKALFGDDVFTMANENNYYNGRRNDDYYRIIRDGTIEGSSI